MNLKCVLTSDVWLENHTRKGYFGYGLGFEWVETVTKHADRVLWKSIMHRQVYGLSSCRFRFPWLLRRFHLLTVNKKPMLAKSKDPTVGHAGSSKYETERQGL